MKTTAGHLLMITVSLCCLCGVASAATYIVDLGGGGDFTGIQEAVEYAANQDTLLVMAGQYNENITCSGKCLTFVGEGPGVTVLEPSEPEPTVVLTNVPWPPGESVFANMTILHDETDGRAVSWIKYRATFMQCEVPGELRGGNFNQSYASTTITECTVGQVRIWGGYYGASIVTASEIGSASFTGRYIYDWGASWCEGHTLETCDSVFGDLTLACDSGITSNSDVIGVLSGNDRTDCYATGSTFGSIELGFGDLELLDCIVTGSAEVNGFASSSSYANWDVDIEGTVIQGDLTLDYSAYGDQVIFTIRVAHNTVLGDLTTLFDFSGSPSYVSCYDVLSNIVGGHTSLDGAFAWAANTSVLNNDWVGGFTFGGVVGTVQFNISLPPLFCDTGSGDYHLQECSPCVGAAHDGGDIGVFGVGCECSTAVEQLSWASIKALYRQPSN